MIYFIFFLMILVYILYNITISNPLFLNINDKYHSIITLERLKSSFYICSNAFDIEEDIDYKPKNYLGFNDIKGCKESLLSFGWNNDDSIPSFLRSYCNLFFKNEKVYLKIEKYALERSTISKFNRNFDKITNKRLVKKYEQYCGGKGIINVCTYFYIPSYIANEEGKTVGFYVYKFILCEVI